MKKKIVLEGDFPDGLTTEKFEKLKDDFVYSMQLRATVVGISDLDKPTQVLTGLLQMTKKVTVE